MPNQFRFEVVPVSEVPPPASSIKVNGLEAVPVEEGQVFAGSVGTLKQGAVGYEVRGFASAGKVWIIKEQGKCQLLREVHCDEAEWLGEFGSVEEALRALTSK